MSVKPVEEFEALVSLHRLTYGHPGSALKLLRYYGSASAVLAKFDPDHIRLPAQLLKNFSKRTLSAHRVGVANDIRWSEIVPQRQIVTIFDDTYPRRLKAIPDPPLCLFAWGDISLLSRDQIAIVGSRKPTQQGLKIAEYFASGLSNIGLTITSGMAFGIDAAAHRGVLAVNGETIVVQGCGADMIYPRSHERLARKILESGLILSEYPTQTGAFAAYFPQRNRIVTGLSLGTLVVEAALRSGSLISAKLAMDQGREVFAVPGSVFSRQSEGCHQLIAQGAKLTASLEDIIEELQGFHVEFDKGKVQELTPEQASILQYLSGVAVSIDQLHELTEEPVSSLMVKLIALEIEGLVESTSLGYVLSELT